MRMILASRLGTCCTAIMIAACKVPYPADVPDDDTVDALPVCTSAPGDAGDCRSCTADADCESDFCFRDTCAPSGLVLFVRPDGVDGANACTDRTRPCRTLTQALANVPATGGIASATRRYIDLMTVGGYAEPANVSIDDKTVVIRGAPPVAGARSVIAPMGSLQLTNGADVQLERLALSDPDVGGIVCSRSTLFANDVRVVDNNATGIRGEPCAVTLRNSVVPRNAGGGVSVEGDRVVIVNNVFVENGAILSAFGALRVSGVPSASVIQSNTIVANRAATGQSDGIDCSAVALRLRNHIILGEAGRARVSGNCTYDHALYGPDDPGGQLAAVNGNMLVADDALLQFVDTAHHDYQIKSSSIAKGKGTSTGLAPESATDIDGQPRPQGAPDVGADEIPD